MIGGTTTWLGPLVGSAARRRRSRSPRVTISSELNLLIVGVVLVAFVILAPEALSGLCGGSSKREHA